MALQDAGLDEPTDQTLIVLAFDFVEGAMMCPVSDHRFCRTSHHGKKHVTISVIVALVVAGAAAHGFRTFHLEPGHLKRHIKRLDFAVRSAHLNRMFIAIGKGGVSQPHNRTFVKIQPE